MMEERVFIKDQWNIACTSVGVNEMIANDWFDLLSRLYSEERRAYHTFHHIWSMLKALQEIKVVEVDNRIAIVFAIFFHDCIYDPTRRDNEELSAQQWLSFCDQSGVIIPFRDSVADWIRQTAHHMDCNAESSTRDKLLFLDIDLAILAAPRSDYDLYAQQIRKEYAHVPDDAFREGRSKVLRTFLAKESLYFLDGSFSTAIAHENISAELERLVGRN